MLPTETAANSRADRQDHKCLRQRWHGASSRKIGIKQGNAGGVHRDWGRWRRDRDSNPGDGLPPTHFPGVRLRPLGHLSVGCVTSPMWWACARALNGENQQSPVSGNASDLTQGFAALVGVAGLEPALAIDRVRSRHNGRNHIQLFREPYRFPSGSKLK